MNAAETVRSYYDALRDGDPLGTYFAGERAGDGELVKFGISERLIGSGAIRDGLREQTETTTDWAVESRALRTTERDRHAWFSDDVAMAWTDLDRGTRFEFDTRWSGTLEWRDAPDHSLDGENDGGEHDGDEDGTAGWRFVGMHVSTAGDI